MSVHQRLKTAESVSPEHPDKLCDRVSDSILDAFLAADPNSRVAVETAGGHGKIFITGEVTSTATVNVKKIAQDLTRIDDVTVHIVQQSPEIANGVDTGGAGDQGIMVGYATDETPEFLPREVVLSRHLNEHLFSLWPYDGKTQVTLRGDVIDAVVTSWQNVPQAELTKAVSDWLKENAPQDSEPRLIINPAGDWSQGGFEADAGLTGRKLVVDNYGPRIPVGGGAFSGKDPSKVDRSAAYMARRIAVDYLKKRGAHEVFCYLAYAIGVAEPVEATVVVDGETEEVEGYDLTPAGIIKTLDLRRPQYAETARYGHFGHGFTWDK